MARAFILSPRLSDNSVISSSSSVSNMTANNLLKARPKLFWRSSGATAYVEGNLGDARSLDTLVMGCTNSRAGATADTFRLRLATTQANLTASPGFDSATLNPGGVRMWPTGSDLSPYLLPHRVWTFAEQTYQWFRIDFDFSTNIFGYVQIARIIIGKRIEPTVSVQSGWEIGGNEDVIESISMGNEETSRIVGVKRSHTVVWHNLSESERESIYTLLLERGSAKDLVVAIEDSEGLYPMSRAFIGRVKRAFSFKQTMLAGSNIHYYTVSITVEELAPIEMIDVPEVVVSP